MSQEIKEKLVASPLFKRQLFRFIIVGCSAVITDLLCYFALLTILPPAVAKTISFIAGTGVAFIFNKYWTFEKKERSHIEVIRFIILYSTTLITNVSINELFLYFFPALTLLAFFLATGTSTTLNFIGQKWWVFKQ